MRRSVLRMRRAMKVMREMSTEYLYHPCPPNYIVVPKTAMCLWCVSIILV